MARREITVSVDVDAPVETVWREVTDWENQGDWMLGTSVKVTHGDGVSLGTRIAAFTGVGPVGFTDTMELVGWDPPHRATMRHTGSLVRGSGVFTVVERRGDDGREGSTFTMSEQLDLPLGPLGALGWPVVRPAFAWGLQRSLDDLARRCESRT
ncbi:SRPBCC family protein [Actinomycetospora flava]|uniref:SRPBCC family protein n=1 Tax=Actinomycetospora flava TaxID=3129232 RepID=A0ABU8MEP7_9PSEU